jgi:hypothetical protein
VSSVCDDLTLRIYKPAGKSDKSITVVLALDSPVTLRTLLKS